MEECETSGRKRKYCVLLPRRLSTHPDDDLLLMLLSLKTTRTTLVTHIMRIERELARRGVDSGLITRQYKRDLVLDV